METGDLSSGAVTESARAEYVILNEETTQPLMFAIIQRWTAFILRVHVPYARYRIISVSTLAAFPLLLLCIRRWQYSALSAGWAIWLSMADCVMLLCAWRVWDAALFAGPQVNEMLSSVSAAEKDALESWYLKWFRPLPQIMACVAGSSIITYIALLLPRPIVEKAPVTIASLALSGFISGFGAYSIAFTSFYCYRLSRVPGMSMLWNAPIKTPGIMMLSAAVQLEARLGMIMFVPVTIPLLYAYIRLHNLLLRGTLLLLMTTPISCIAIVGLVAQGWLAQAVRRSKDGNLQQVAYSIDLVRAGRSLAEMSDAHLSKLKDQLDVFDKLRTSPDSFLQTTAVSQYVGALIAAIVPIVIAFLFR